MNYTTLKKHQMSKKISNQLIQSMKKFIVLSNLGQLIQLKGQSHLIRILEKIKKDYENVKLFIIGTGEMELI